MNEQQARDEYNKTVAWEYSQSTGIWFNVYYSDYEIYRTKSYTSNMYCVTRNGCIAHIADTLDEAMLFVKRDA